MAVSLQIFPLRSLFLFWLRLALGKKQETIDWGGKHDIISSLPLAFPFVVAALVRLGGAQTTHPLDLGGSGDTVRGGTEKSNSFLFDNYSIHKQRCLYFSPLLALLTTTATNKTMRARAKVEGLMVDWLMQLENNDSAAIGLRFI